MPTYFDQKNLDSLASGRKEMRRQFNDLRERFIGRAYKTERGKEFALQGFCRRLGTMARAIDKVFDDLPPDRDDKDIPTKDTVTDATLAIQGFVVNAFGCLENLAWIWVLEKPVLDPNGKQLNPLQIGLAEKNKEVRASFTKEFLEHLAKRQDWVDHLKNFRDSLAHRIPLYIPPYIIPTELADKYGELEKSLGDAIRRRDFKAYGKIQAEQNGLGVWRPWMTHSVSEKSKHVVFHWQLLQDYVTIDEFGREMLEEMERQKV